MILPPPLRGREQENTGRLGIRRPAREEGRLRAQERGKAVDGVRSAKQAPRRPGTALALGLRAGNCVISILPRTEGDSTMRLRKRSVPRVEQLEDRCLLSADVVVEWNQRVLDAIRQTNANPLVASRAL